MASGLHQHRHAPGLRIDLSFQATERRLTASGGGQTVSMELPPVGFEPGLAPSAYGRRRDNLYDLSALAKTVCELKGITERLPNKDRPADQPPPSEPETRKKRRKNRPSARKRHALKARRAAQQEPGPHAPAEALP